MRFARSAIIAFGTIPSGMIVRRQVKRPGTTASRAVLIPTRRLTAATCSPRNNQVTNIGMCDFCGTEGVPLTRADTRQFNITQEEPHDFCEFCFQLHSPRVVASQNLAIVANTIMKQLRLIEQQQQVTNELIIQRIRRLDATIWQKRATTSMIYPFLRFTPADPSCKRIVVRPDAITSFEEWPTLGWTAVYTTTTTFAVKETFDEVERMIEEALQP